MESLNLIVVVIDSLRQDHVSHYSEGRRVFRNVPACKTPNLDRFAGESVVFSDAYPSGLPTIPVRTELMTGQFTLPYKPWSPMYPTEITIAETLGREGYVSGLVTDTYHLFKPGMNFHKGFDSFNWIRGQEYDAYNSAPPTKKRTDDYVDERFDDRWRRLVERFNANTEDFEAEEDWFPAKVFSTAAEWLRKNSIHKKVFLWVDSFDPHEPWDPPAAYDRYTSKDYMGLRIILPMGGEAKDWATEEETDFIRGLYAGEVSFVDYCFGEFYAAVRESGLLDSSVVAVLADHGHPLADHGKFLKGGDRLYNELLKVPFMVRLPGGKPARDTRALVQFPDLAPTLLEIMGMKNDTYSMHGGSFLSVLDGADTHREFAISGYYEAPDRCVRDGKWSYIHRPEGQPDELYDLESDPRERHNLVDEKPDEARRLASAFGSYFRRESQLHIKGLQGKYELS